MKTNRFSGSITFSILLLTLPLLSLVLAACSGTDATTIEPERPPLKVEWTYWPGFYPMAIALELGLFEKHNVEVESLFYEEGAQALADFSARKFDGAMFVPGGILELATKTPLKIVLAVDYSDGADQVVAAPDITSVADLRGKRVAYTPGDFSQVFILKMLEQNGMTPDDVILTTVEAEVVPEHLPDLIDAASTWEPHTSRAVAAGNHVIFSSADTPGLIVDVVVFHASVVAERPEDIRAFIAAWFEAVDYWAAHPEESAEMIAKHTGLSPEEISSEGIRLLNLQDNREAFTRGEDSSLYSSTQEYIDLYIATGRIGSRPDLDELFDPSYLD